MIAKIDFNSS